MVDFNISLRFKKQTLLNEVMNVLSFNPINNYEFIEDVNKLITLFNNEYKKDIYIKVYFERINNSNPYYVNNHQLNKCAQLIQKLLSIDFSALNSGQARKIIDSLYKKLISNSQEVDYDNKISEIKAVFSNFKLNNLFNNFIKNNIFILNFRGGNRNTLSCECEFDILLKVYKDINADDAINVIDDLARKYGAKIKIIRG